MLGGSVQYVGGQPPIRSTPGRTWRSRPTAAPCGLHQRHPGRQPRRDQRGPTTTNPLWVGGSQPYCEDFEGVIDEVQRLQRGAQPSGYLIRHEPPLDRSGVSPQLF
jgi:hypothetical protein